MDAEDEVWINSKTNLSTSPTVEENWKTRAFPRTTCTWRVPQIFGHFLIKKRPIVIQTHNYKIKMKPGFKSKSFKTYNLTLEEQIELDKFLKENLDKKYIKPSESPMASPFFFVKKKYGKLWPCQDYHYDWMIKNTYPCQRSWTKSREPNISPN